MGWKNLKQEYRIEHIVCVTKEGICIGSPYIHNIIVVGLDGVLRKRDDGRSNSDLKRYMADFDSDPVRLKNVVLSLDTFETSIPVYTYDGGEIIENQCEKVGWPNVTHDGKIMYENTHSADKAKIVQIARDNAKAGVRLHTQYLEEAEQALEERRAWLNESLSDVAALESAYPSNR